MISAADFKRIVNKYFEECAESGVFPDEAGMIFALKLTREEFDNILSGRAEGKGAGGMRRAALAARLKRESLLTRELFATEKTATAKIFLARQPASGALSEKTPDVSDSAALEVRILGDHEAFE